MKDNAKITILIASLVLIIALILGGTLAYWQWATSAAENTLVNVSLTDDAKMYIDFPSEEITDMYPTNDCEANGTSSWVSEITVDNGTGVLLSPVFKLKVKIEDKNGNIITNAKNAGNTYENRYYIKYAVTDASESCQNALITGRFDQSTQTVSGNSTWYDSKLITLYDDTTGFPIVSGRNGSGVSFYARENAWTIQRYKVWVWLDKDYVSVSVGESVSDSMQDAKVTVSWSENSELEQVKRMQKMGEAIAIYSEDDASLRFYRVDNVSSIAVGNTYKGRTVSEMYTGFETSDYSDATSVPWYEVKESVESIIFEDYIYPVSTAHWFNGFNAPGLIQNFYLDASKLDVSNVMNMTGMFSRFLMSKDDSVVGLDNWDTSNVIDMSMMFAESNLYNTIGIEKWDTANVINMTDLFTRAGMIGVLDLTGWNVCKVTGQFSDISSGNIIEPYFDDRLCAGGKAYAVYSADDNSLRFYRSKTPITVGSRYRGRMVTEVYTDFESTNSVSPPWKGKYYELNYVVFEDKISPLSTNNWFAGPAFIEIDVTNLDVSYVTSMVSMFASSTFPNGIIGIENWDTSNVTDMYRMFYASAGGKKVDLSKWNICNVYDHSDFSVSYDGLVEPNWDMPCP